MRAPSDMPRRPPRKPGRGRAWLVIGAVVLLFLVMSLRGIAGFYTDYLWFDSLDRASVWRGVLGAKIALDVIFTGTFFLIMWTNLGIPNHLAPPVRRQGPGGGVTERYPER